MIKKYLEFFEKSSKNDMWDSIPNSVKEIHRIFKKNNRKLYLVGGSVRDFIKGDDPKDFDLCTDAVSDEIIEILNSNNYKTNEVGKDFGVVIVYTDDQPNGMEVATFREDEYDYKSRNPKIKFSTIEFDVLRRDLTINSLFYDLEKRKIIDMVNGLDDIKNGIIRMVGDPKERINQDPLRIMRIIRFSYRYGFDIDDDTFNSAKELGSSLSRITKERVWEEVKKSFKYSGDFKIYLDIISKLSIWEYIFPNVKINTDTKSCKYLPCYMANLFRENDLNGLERKMTLDFKIESDTSSKSCYLLKLMDLSPDNVFMLYKDKIRCHISDDMILDWVKLNKLDMNLFNSFIKYEPSISSEDLMNKGFKGKELGDEIKRLESELFNNLLSHNSSD